MAENAATGFMFDIQSLEFKEDFSAIDILFVTVTLVRIFRAYLHHLFRANKLKLFDSEAEREPTYLHLATIHNMRFMMRLMEKIREGIRKRSLAN
jgi:queuine tRNA-ribosyltransferase